MNRTITLIVDNSNNTQLVVGGYELDEGGLVFTAQVLRVMLVQVERELIRKQILNEQTRVSNDPDSTAGGVSPDGPTTDRAAGGDDSPEVQGGEAGGEAGADRE